MDSSSHTRALLNKLDTESLGDEQRRRLEADGTAPNDAYARASFSGSHGSRSQLCHCALHP